MEVRWALKVEIHILDKHVGAHFKDLVVADRCSPFPYSFCFLDAYVVGSQGIRLPNAVGPDHFLTHVNPLWSMGRWAVTDNR